MRWFVEVNSIGKTEKHSYCVAADTWQRALQFARSLRSGDPQSDGGPITGFSIELLDDGFSAVDPMSRLRYYVKHAPDDAPLTEPRPLASTAVPASSSLAAGPPTTPSSKAPPRPAVHAPPAPVAAHVQGAPAPAPPAAALSGSAAADSARKARSKTVAFGSIGSAVVASPGPQAPLRPAAPPPPAPPAPALVAPSVAPPTVPGLELVFKREQEPDNRTPLTYREYVYVVAPGTEELMARVLLVAQFELVKSTLDPARSGNFVNLAVFDVPFRGRPSVPPLVTLSWKDWKGEPVVELRRPPRAPGTSGTRQSPSSARMPVAPKVPLSVRISEPLAAMQLPSVMVAATPEPPPPLPMRAVAPPAVFPSEAYPVAVLPLAASPLAPPVVAPPPLAAPPSLTPSWAPPQAPPRALPTPPPSEPSGPAFPLVAHTPLAPRTPAHGVRRTSRPGLNGRLRGDELIADLFEAMHDLHFLRDAVEGADFCLTLALEKMPSHAGIVHLYDIDKREFVIVRARGVNAEDLLLERLPEGEPTLHAAMRRQRAIVVVDATCGPAAGAARYQILGGAKSLVVAPVLLAGRFLGAIELMNPVDGAPFTDNEGHALTYIGEQYAEFVATRGVLLDPERIAPNAAGPLLR